MNELQKTMKSVITMTGLLSVVASILCWVIFRSFKVFLGVWIGCLIGIMGLLMISKFAMNLTGDEEAGKKQGQSNYLIRYGFYTVSLLAATLAGIPVLSMLVGILCSKGAIVLYALKEGQE